MPRTSKPIERLPSGKWVVRYRDDAGRQRKKTFDTSREANTFLDQTREAVRRGTYTPPKAGQEMFGDFAERWAAAQDWADSTREGFGYHLRRLGPLNTRRIDQIDKLTLQQVRADLTKKYATATATISLHYATTIMKAAYDSGLVARDATVGLKPPKRRDGKSTGAVGPEQVPTRNEVVAIMGAAPPPFRAAIALGACGLRIGEVLGATEARLDLRAGILDVDRQLQYREGRPLLKLPKRDKTRQIGLPSWARLELRRHLAEHGPFFPLSGEPDTEALLFRGSRGAALRRDDFYRAAWYPALEAAGLGRDAYVFHSLRHWCASAMLAAGTPTTAVAGHLGDTVETVHRTYAHWLRDDRDIPATVLDGLLSAVADEVG